MCENYSQSAQKFQSELKAVKVKLGIATDKREYCWKLFLDVLFINFFFFFLNVK